MLLTKEISSRLRPKEIWLHPNCGYFQKLELLKRSDSGGLKLYLFGDSPKILGEPTSISHGHSAEFGMAEATAVAKEFQETFNQIQLIIKPQILSLKQEVRYHFLFRWVVLLIVAGVF
jgi:hypothetical protein